MKVAVVHDWLVTYAGAERVLEQIIALYPEADIFSLVDFLPDDARGFILGKRARTSFIQRLPRAREKYRSYLPLMPLAIGRMDMRGYDLVISSSYAVAKGVRTSGGQPHLCYCHSPIRYAWDLREQYLSESGLDRGVKGFMARRLLDYIKAWDRATSGRPDRYIANSAYIADRIMRAYGRESRVIHPPVDTEGFPLSRSHGDYYLTASRMVPYKRVPLIVEAFSMMPQRRLVVIGDGPEMPRARQRASANVELLGYQGGDVLRERMQGARAFVFAAEEDFGIVPVEAQACGTPVIAYGRGGALETVVDGVTGVFFSEQTPGAIVEAVERFEAMCGAFSPEAIRRNAERFGVERFRSEFREAVDSLLQAPPGQRHV